LEKVLLFTFKQPVRSVIFLSKPTFTLRCLSAQNLTLQHNLQVVDRRDLSNHIYTYVPSTLLRMW